MLTQAAYHRKDTPENENDNLIGHIPPRAAFITQPKQNDNINNTQENNPITNNQNN